MLTAGNLLELEYTPDLTRAGIHYVCRLLPQLTFNEDEVNLNQLREIVADKVVELAFRRNLVESKVPHNLVSSISFIEPDTKVVTLGGRRCTLKTFFVSRRRDIRLFQHNPDSLFQANFPILRENVFSEHHSDEDIYIFGCLMGLVAGNKRDQKRVRKKGLPFYNIFLPPQPWVNPKRWRSLGSIVLKCDTTLNINLEFGGRDSNRVFVTEQVNLYPHRKQYLDTEFYTLNYVHVLEYPDGKVGVHSHVLNDNFRVRPFEWENLWVYGTKILLIGYITHGEFRRKCTRVSPNTRWLKKKSVRGDYSAMLMGELRPISDLFARVRNWINEQD
jgi:hypothetical protein